VLTLSSNNIATQGEVRLAKRNSIYPEDWSYKTLDGPDSGVAVAGYEVTITNSGDRIVAGWFAASGFRLPRPDEVRYLIVDQDEKPTRISPDKYGTPSPPLTIDSKGIIFGCESRLCSVSSYSSIPKLINGSILNSVTESSFVTINGIRYAITSILKQLVLAKL
jgi:hypothetical protein